VRDKVSRRIQFNCAVYGLIDHPAVFSMNRYIHHSRVTCFDHCVFVAYLSFLVCLALGLDARSAARGALLHDMFLYDWHIKSGRKGRHGFTHPAAALANATRHFDLNEMEKDIIKKHMFPLTPIPPKYKESLVVCFVDKICTAAEVFRLYRQDHE